ncbi:hypothetical protein ABTN14_19190, partial [Acinetobacter baumannii]
VLRQVPIWENGAVSGVVDLALERSFVWRRNAPSETVAIPAAVLDREKEARFDMLERLADYDEDLLEQLLSEVEPEKARVFADLTREFRD